MIDASTNPAPFTKAGVPLAVGLQTSSGFDSAINMGFSGAAGWFFLNDKPAGKKPSAASAHILELLDLVRQEAKIEKIEEALKRDVAVSYKLLRFVNSASFGHRSEIQNFRQAVSLLGYKQLYKWLSLLLVSASNNPQSQALRQAAITRGRMMEILGQGFFSKEECDRLFITGAFSLLDIMMEADLHFLLESMRLPAPILDALLHDKGAYSPFLKLALACENHPDEIAEQARQLGLSAKAINRASLIALSYADHMQSV